MVTTTTQYEYDDKQLNLPRNRQGTPLQEHRDNKGVLVCAVLSSVSIFNDLKNYNKQILRYESDYFNFCFS